MPRQIMLSDTAYTMLAKRKGDRSFSELILELIEAEKTPKKNPRLLLELKPWDWGPGSENSSTEIDEILYGGHL